MDEKEEETAAVWALFKTNFSYIFREVYHGDDVKKITTVLKNLCCIQSQTALFVPSKQKDETECDFKKKFQVRIAQVTWLVGQLMQIICRKGLSNLHQISIEVQISILGLLAEKNNVMFRVLIMEYIQLLEDLLNARDAIGNLKENEYMIERFHPNKIRIILSENASEYDSEHYPFIIKSTENCSILLETLLPIISSQFSMLVDCCSDLLSPLWNLIVRSLLDKSKSVVTATINMIANLVHLNEFNCESIATLNICQRIGIYARAYKYDDDNIFVSKGLEAYKNLFDALIERNGTDHVLHNNCLLDSLIPLIEKDSSFIKSDIVSYSTCKLVAILLPSWVIGEDCILKKQVKKLLTDVFYCTKIVPIIEELVKKEMIISIQGKQQSPHRMIVEGKGEEEISLMQCEIWKTVCDFITHEIAKLDQAPSAGPDQELMKLTSSIVQSAANLIESLDSSQNGNIIAFNDTFLSAVTSLTCNTSTITNISCFQFLITMITDLLLLPESENIDENILTRLVRFVSLPISEKTEDDGTLTSSQSIRIISMLKNESDNSIIEKIQKDCIICLGRMVPDAESDFRVKLLVDCFNKNVHSKEIIESVPFFLQHLSSLFPVLGHSILQPSLTVDELQIPAAETVSAVTCIMSGTGYSTRVPGQSRVKIMCKECDLGTEEGQLSSNDQIHKLLTCILSLLSSKSEQVLCKIISLLPRLANHLSLVHTLECVNRWIVLIKHPTCEVRQLFVEVVADLLFKKKWIKRHEDCVIEEVGLLSQYDRQELMNSELLFTSFSSVAMTTVFDSLVNLKKNLQMTTMAAIVRVGSTPLDFVLYPSFKMLLMYVLHPKSINVDVSGVYLQKIAEEHNKLKKDIFFKYRNEFCKQLVDMFMCNMPLSRESLSNLLQKFSRALSYEKEETFLAQNACSHLIKYILQLMIKNPELEWVLHYVGDRLEKDVSTLIKEGFQHIFPYFYINESKDALNKVCAITENLTGKSKEALIKSCYKSIVCEILLHIEKKKECVLDALNYLKSHVFTQEEYTSDVIEFLAPRFLGVVGMMESRLVSRDSSDNEKKNVLLALPEIFSLMGPKHITPVRLRIIAMLREALKLCHSTFPELTCEVWVAFFHSVDLTALAPLISTIFISLLPLLENFCSIISRIFHFLVIENYDKISTHVHELFFVPNHDSIQVVYDTIQQKIEEHKKLSVREQFEIAIKIANHENVDVRLHGLKKLKNYLTSNWTFISDLILNNDALDPIVIKFFEAVITGSRDENENIRMASGECLGSLGALDPGYLTANLLLEKNNQQEPLFIASNEFAIAALMCLTKALQEARHTFLMDCLALAIQELLKTYDVSPKFPIWKEFPEDIQKTISPFLKTRYLNCQNAINRSPVNIHPIFGSALGNTVKNWAYNWASFLIPLASSDELASHIFNVCHPSLKKDMQVLLFFMPYIFLHAVLNSSEENKKKIEEEIMAVICWYEKHKMAEKIVFQSQKVRKTLIKFETPVQSELGLSTVICTKIVYSLIDFLHRWQKEAKKQSKNSQNTAHETVLAFLKRFSKLDIANGSIHCQEYTRALLYLEEYAVENPRTLQDLLPTFGKVYSYLKEPDGLRGIIAIHEKEPAPEEMLLYHTHTGHLHDAATCYENLAQQNDAEYLKGMVKCYLSMDQPCTALKIAEAVISKDKCNIDLYGEQAEAVWSLGMMDKLENILKTPEKKYDKSWGVSIGKAILHLRNEDKPAMIDQLQSIRQIIIQQLSTATVTSGGYRQGYDYIVKLHILDEFEKMGNMLLSLLSGDNQFKLEQFQKLVSHELEQRLKLLQPTHHVLQPVLCMRRVVLSIAEGMLSQKCPNVTVLLKQVISKCWLKSISLARKSSNFQQAYSNILTVQKLNPKALFIEQAKLHCAKSECQAAITTLRRGIEKNFPDISGLSDLERKLLAKAKLLVATYNDANMNIDLETNLKCYKEAVDVCKTWEKSLVCLAQFKYRIFRESRQDDDFCSKSNMDSQLHIINHFGKSLEYGCKYIYQSMPRMLEIWLDFGTVVAKNRKSKNHRNLVEQENTLTSMIKTIEEYLRRLPTYAFMTAMSQLISRICHPHPACAELLKKIVVKIIKAYPQQALWMIIFVYKSSYSVRVKRCEAIFQSIRDDVQLARLVKHFTDLTGKLVELSSKPVDEKCLQKGRLTSVRYLVGSLPKLFESPGFSQILIPAQKFRTLSLPRSTEYNNHNPYSETFVYIRGIKDEVQVLNSLQRPKKIIFLGSDGLEYPVLCKSKDDLRLDSRLMEFSSILNMYLQRTPEARDRRLHINTYNVVALNEENGLIEWVGNLVGMRLVILGILRQKGISVPRSEMERIVCVKSDPLSKKRQVFLEKILPRYPAVLREWFPQEFPHPNAWYQARSAFVRSTAVMSIVGYIVGLGDRHGENILLDSTSGEVMHVDFNCLFNKGESLDFPERVPFRLTHNMVNAMGPTGYEGMFVEACEITIRLMRAQIEQLLSVVRPFIYDPLCSWNRDRTKRDENAEMTNEKAREHILNIQHRLLGHVRNNAGVFTERVLSVEGQTQSLIAEATNVDNLCQMYMGWGPYL